VTDLSGRTILITGAGRGFGRAIAMAAGRAGAHVVVAAPHENGADAARAIEAAGGSAHWVRCDVTNGADVEAAFEAAGTVHGVVHNATSRLSNVPAKLSEIDDAEYHVHASVSLLGAYHCARAALPRLPSTGGRFVLMTSPAGMEGSLGNPLYGVVKGGIRGFTKSLAREWAPLGHTVTCVSPLAATEALTVAFENDPTMEERLTKRVPLGWFGDPERDVAPPVLFLLSDDAHYITGQTLVVDGGRYMIL
jgi:NAD(P)-dependent dehydrogenase (short-subunit alcohol dehydrogenase family)